MDGAGTDTLTLQDYIASVDKSTLPRILQICSGVYFQGSVYEMSGNESTTCEDISTNDTSELPLDYRGGFCVVPEDMPFCSVEEMVYFIPTEPDARDTFSFTCRHDLVLECSRVAAGEAIALLSVERQDGKEDGEGQARCCLIGRKKAAEFLVPLSLRGEFYECDSSHSYSVREIVTSPRLWSRRYRRAKATKCSGPLILRPVYQVQVIMHMRKNIVRFPSSLEVDVMDVTERSQDVVFVTPLTLLEVAAQPPEAFPAVAEILEAPESAGALFRCDWLQSLRPGRLLVLHSAGESALMLASSFKGNKKERRHFLLSLRYAGGFRRRPRDFSSAYELYAASCQAPGSLRVSVASHCESGEDGLVSLSVGDQLEVLRRDQVEVGCRDNKERGQGQEVEVLVCRRTLEVDDKEDEEEEEGWGEEDEEVCLPMYLQGHFVETITDNKRYSLAELGKHFALPLDAKVVRRDPAMESDPLLAFPALRLEEVSATELTVLASLPEKPGRLFELPARWLTMSVSFTANPLPWADSHPPEWHQDTVTEVTDELYFEFRKLACQDAAPPPRPPKRRVSTVKTSNAPPHLGSSSTTPPCHTKSQSLPRLLDKLNLKSLPPLPLMDITGERAPPIPRKPVSQSNSFTQSNMYGKTPMNNKKGARRRNSDHDYEEVSQSTQDSIMFY
ncbi:hypothetical protein AAFF_G00330260 [Aldrovandia affinis]|uniref:CABIT domain-containing protein n=1 Tax=Aldrovandia affinis TaxID=143900 RepID=A0AAD7WQB5_9TELE|nr:hypothetical protein AAFF_G00330260 [Aldrovandia affinis]